MSSRLRQLHQLGWIYAPSASKELKLCRAYVAPPHHGPIDDSDRGLASYWDTAPPTATQLRQAEKFFGAAPPKLMFSASKFRTMDNSAMPEVAFLGRSNVGKSSLLNALMGQKICHTSSKPGRTRSMNFFAVGGEDGHGNLGKLAVLDMPGYGKGSQEEWGPEIMKYLVNRKQLRRAFLLVDALHGLKSSDETILSMFRQNAISHQIILSKVDRVLFKKPRPSLASMERNFPRLDDICGQLKSKIQPGIGDGPEALGEIVTCSAETALNGKKLGIGNVRWAVLAATGLSERKRKLLPSEMSTDTRNDGVSTGNTIHPDSLDADSHARANAQLPTFP